MCKENSLKSWWIWSCAVVYYFYCFIARSSFVTVLANDFMRFYQIDAAGLGALGSCYYWVYTCMQIPVGMICDRFSLRKVATLMCIITSIGVFTMVATSNCYIAGIGEMIIGFGSAFAFILCLKIITSWFPENKIAIMTAYTMSLGAFGPVVGGPAVSFITDHFDWRTVIMVYSGIGLLLAVAIWGIVRDAPKSEHTEHNEQPIMQTLISILKSKQTWILAIFTMAMYAPLSALGDLWGVQFVETVFKTDRMSAAIANNMLYIGLMLGAPLFAYLAGVVDSYKKMMIIGILGEAIFLGIAVGVGGLPAWTAFVLFFIVGLCTGGMLTYPLALALFPQQVGATVSGFINMSSMVSGIILMPLVGWIVNLSWDGTMLDGMKVYSATDFKMGVAAVVAFICLGVISTLFIKDRSPKTGEYN